jgi:hypothetical protein
VSRKDEASSTRYGDLEVYIRDRDLYARRIGGVGPIQPEDDESFFKKEGKNIVSRNPCGSSDCKVCEGAEIYHDDFEVYNWDF